MLLHNLDCDGTQLHAPLLPSVAHKLLASLNYLELSNQGVDNQDIV